VRAMRAETERHGGEFVAKPRNEGYSKTINVGLRRALNEGRDAITVNADIEFRTTTWLDLMLKQKSEQGDRLAGIVGGLLLYPNNLIQHAGIFFSLLYREWDHIYRYAPCDLPEAKVARTCPVTGALQFIRHSVLDSVGLYDELFKLGWEDVDFCVRAWQAGEAIVMQPMIWAIHHESFFRGNPSPKNQKWQAESWARFVEKHGSTSFAELVPSLI